MALSVYTRTGPDGRPLRTAVEVERALYQVGAGYRRNMLAAGGNNPIMPWDIDAPRHVRRKHEQNTRFAQDRERRRNAILEEAERAESALRANQIKRKTQGMSPMEESDFRQQLALQERYEEAQQQKEWYFEQQKIDAARSKRTGKRRGRFIPDPKRRERLRDMASLRERSGLSPRGF